VKILGKISWAEGIASAKALKHRTGSSPQWLEVVSRRIFRNGWGEE